jgi:type IV secretion system protein TrbI
MGIKQITEEMAPGGKLSSKAGVAILVAAGLLALVVFISSHLKAKQTPKPTLTNPIHAVDPGTVNQVRENIPSSPQEWPGQLAALNQKPASGLPLAGFGSSPAPATQGNPYIMPAQVAPSAPEEPQYSSPLALSFRAQDEKLVPTTSDPPPQAASQPAKEDKPDYFAEPGQFDSFTGSQYLVAEGTVIPCVLVNDLQGEFTGPVIAQVSQAVYSHDRKHVLIPVGAKVIGESRQVGNQDQARLAISFHRLIFPDEFSVSLDQQQGLDQEGAAGVHDKVNRHWTTAFGAAIAVGILGGLSEYNTGSALTASGLDMYRQGVAMQAGEEGQQLLSRFLNRMPTIEIRPGTRVDVFISRDLMLPAVENHRMSPSL